MTFKRVNDFSTEDPAKLDRELSQLEDNVNAEFSLVRRQMAPLASAVTFTPIAAQPIVAIQPDQQLSVDTGIVSGNVVFPDIKAENFGRKFVIIKRLAANSIFCSCSNPNVKRNGTTFPTITAVGVTTFYCDSAGYYT